MGDVYTKSCNGKQSKEIFYELITSYSIIMNYILLVNNHKIMQGCIQSGNRDPKTPFSDMSVNSKDWYSYWYKHAMHYTIATISWIKCYSALHKIKQPVAILTKEVHLSHSLILIKTTLVILF